MTKRWHLPRRTFLKGLGTVIGLPLLECMVPALQASAGDTSQAFPKRMAYVYVPNGANMADWTPRAAGADYELPMILEPLQAHRNDLMVISNLAQNKANGNGDGGGDHARASATFLTSAQARKSASNIRIGVSVDQVAAARIGNQTRLASLELSCDGGQEAGSCDSGYSCAYQFNIAWRSESQPMTPIVEPRQVFERLFGGGIPGESRAARERRERLDASVLDFVQGQANDLRGNLGANDRRRLDEYLSAIRDIERNIQQSGRFAVNLPPGAVPNLNGDYNFERHLRLMFDLITLAFQTDTTRICTLIVSHDQSNRAYPQVGVSEGHHHLSHHRNIETTKAKIARINRYHVTQFAYFLEKLKTVREGAATLLDNSMIVYGSGISDGNAHSHDNLPIILAGRAGGTVTPGRHLRLSGQTPMANLFVSMLNRMDVPVERFGDSTGRLEVIA